MTRGGCSRLHIMYVGDAAALYIRIYKSDHIPSVLGGRVCECRSQPASQRGMHVYVRGPHILFAACEGENRARACPGMRLARSRPRPGPQPLSGHSIAPCRGRGAHLQVAPPVLFAASTRLSQCALLLPASPQWQKRLHQSYREEQIGQQWQKLGIKTHLHFV